MRSRQRLHLKHLSEFTKFCEGLGWVSERVKGDYEVLRMRHPNSKELLIVHDRHSASQHYTTWGMSNDLAKIFYRQKKETT